VAQNILSTVKFKKWEVNIFKASHSCLTSINMDCQ
jgi:hypothetical protein